MDKRKTFFKTLDKIGTVETLSGWSVDDKDWADRAEIAARAAVRARGKRKFPRKRWPNWSIASVPIRASSTTKLKNSACSPAGGRQIEFADVAAICTRNKTARAFALGDALGDRDLPRMLSALDEELWELKPIRTSPKSACFTA